MANSNSTTSDISALPAFTKEDFLKRAAAIQQHLRQENPNLSKSELDLKLFSGWYKPVFDHPLPWMNPYPRIIKDKLMVACREFTAADYSQTALDKFSIEARAPLVGHDRALQLVEATILKNPSVWDQMHEHVMTMKHNNGGKTHDSNDPQ